jgi:hypothetical protein
MVAVATIKLRRYRNDQSPVMPATTVCSVTRFNDHLPAASADDYPVTWATMSWGACWRGSPGGRGGNDRLYGHPVGAATTRACRHFGIGAPAAVIMPTRPI